MEVLDQLFSIVFPLFSHGGSFQFAMAKSLPEGQHDAMGSVGMGNDASQLRKRVAGRCLMKAPNCPVLGSPFGARIGD